MSEEPVEAIEDEAVLGAPKIRENVIEVIGYNVAAVRDIPGSFVISEGQPYGPVECLFQTNIKGFFTWKVKVDAGRHKTAPVADAFIGAAGGGSHLFGVGAISDSYPRELNFTYGLEVDLQIGDDIATVPLYFGQGSTLSLVNWWTGSPLLFKPDGSQYWHVIIDIGGVPRKFHYFAINGNTFQFALQ